jgi:hypothetical protein
MLHGMPSRGFGVCRHTPSAQARGEPVEQPLTFGLVLSSPQAAGVGEAVHRRPYRVTK